MTPPIVALEPKGGSSGMKYPFPSLASLPCISASGMPHSTERLRLSMSLSVMRLTRSIPRTRSTFLGSAPHDILVPFPRGVMESFRSLAKATTRETSSIDPGRTAAQGVRPSML